MVLLLPDLVFQNGHLGPARHSVGSDSPAESDPFLGNTESMAPEGMALGERTAQHGVFGNPGSLPLDPAAFRHVYELSISTMLITQERF